MIGFNVFDFLELPSFERSIVRIVLRETRIAYPDLLRAVSAFPPERRIARPRLDVMLDNLTRDGWLVRSDENGQSFYGINSTPRPTSQSQLMETLDTLQVKALSTDDLAALLPSKADSGALRRGGKRALPTSIWNSLNGDTNPTGENPSEQVTKRALNSPLWNKLTDD